MPYRQITWLSVVINALAAAPMLLACSDDGSTSTSHGGSAGTDGGSHATGGAAGSGSGGASATGGSAGTSDSGSAGSAGAGGTGGSGQGGSAGMSGAVEAPTLLAVSQMMGALHVRWSLPTAGCDSIEILRNHDGGELAKAYTLAGTAEDIHDMQAVPPGAYCYRARCVAGGQSSADSNEKCGTP